MGVMDSALHRDFMFADTEHIFVPLSIQIHDQGKKKHVEEK